MYVYQCIFIFLLRDHDNNLFYSEFYPFINSSTLHWGKWNEKPKYMYIYANMYQLYFLYFFETLHDTCRYIYIYWSRDANKQFSWGQFGMKYLGGTGEIGVCTLHLPKPYPHVPFQRHWYLWFLAVAPHAQGAVSFFPLGSNSRSVEKGFELATLREMMYSHSL